MISRHLLPFATFHLPPPSSHHLTTICPAHHLTTICPCPPSHHHLPLPTICLQLAEVTLTEATTAVDTATAAHASAADPDAAAAAALPAADPLLAHFLPAFFDGMPDGAVLTEWRKWAGKYAERLAAEKRDDVARRTEMHATSPKYEPAVTNQPLRASRYEPVHHLAPKLTHTHHMAALPSYCPRTSRRTSIIPSPPPRDDVSSLLACLADSSRANGCSRRRTRVPRRATSPSSTSC